MNPDYYNVLDDRVAVITGASSGIGAATAEELANYGVDITVAARRYGRLEQLRSKLESEYDIKVDEAVVDAGGQFFSLVRDTDDNKL